MGDTVSRLFGGSGTPDMPPVPVQRNDQAIEEQRRQSRLARAAATSYGGPSRLGVGAIGSTGTNRVTAVGDVGS